MYLYNTCVSTVLRAGVHTAYIGFLFVSLRANVYQKNSSHSLVLDVNK